jgi:hypothetical protein
MQMEIFADNHKVKRAQPVSEDKKDVTCIGPTGGESRIDHLLIGMGSRRKIDLMVVRTPGIKSMHAQLTIWVSDFQKSEVGEPFPSVPFPSRKSAPAGDPGWKKYKVNMELAAEKLMMRLRKEQNSGIMWDLISKKMGGEFEKVFGKKHMDRGNRGRKETKRIVEVESESDPAERWRKKMWKEVARAYGGDIERMECLEKIRELEREEESERDIEFEKNVREVTKKLVGAMKANPKKFWDTLRAMKGNRGEGLLPTWMRDGDGWTGTREGLELVWTKTYERKAWTPKSKEAVEWRRTVQTEVNRWEVEIDRMQERVPDISLKEMKEIRAGSSKDGAPGSDMVTGRMKDGGGEKTDELVQMVLNNIMKTEITPPNFKEDIIVPIHKRDGKHIVNNFRPVSLTQEILKELQKICMPE